MRTRAAESETKNRVPLIFYMRSARRKARPLATVEAQCLLGNLDTQVLAGGPLSERGGVFWLAMPASHIGEAARRLPHIGYTLAVDAVVPVDAAPDVWITGRPHDLVRWRKKEHELVRIYEEDEEAIREMAPDRRAFLIEKEAGVVEAVRGYRGDGGALSRRGLPVCDARLLVNLVLPPRRSVRFLDPFAGIGGVIIAAAERGCHTTSVDVDAFVRHGLAALSDEHFVADASRLPFGDETFDAVATEPPYHDDARDKLVTALAEMRRVLKPGGRLAVLCAESQTGVLKCKAAALGLEPVVDAPVDRKGLAVAILVWRRNAGG